MTTYQQVCLQVRLGIPPRVEPSKGVIKVVMGLAPQDKDRERANNVHSH